VKNFDSFRLPQLGGFRFYYLFWVASRNGGEPIGPSRLPKKLFIFLSLGSNYVISELLS